MKGLLRWVILETALFAEITRFCMPQSMQTTVCPCTYMEENALGSQLKSPLSNLCFGQGNTFNYVPVQTFRYISIIFSIRLIEFPYNYSSNLVSVFQSI